jgi:hypothetical protein
MKRVQAAVHCVNEAAENNGPIVLARIGMMKAINRHRNPTRPMTVVGRVCRGDVGPCGPRQCACDPTECTGASAL